MKKINGFLKNRYNCEGLNPEPLAGQKARLFELETRIGCEEMRALSFMTLIALIISWRHSISAGGTTLLHDPKQYLERTSFQIATSYDDQVDLKSDVAIVYGFHGDLDARIGQWRENGYTVHFMTGVAWGGYQDYFHGQWDGKSHEDEAQMDKEGNLILHGPDVPYVAPSETFGHYLCVGVKRAIDAGAQAIYLEEPEFWVRGGYSDSFKREWQAYYNDAWVPPHSSADAQYRASKLKYFLYRRTLQQVFDFVREYSKHLGKRIRCYVPTHSMLNYAHWGIVSPEQSLVMLNGCDGYIGQVWTGTARSANMYKGVIKERTFEYAFFEYGICSNLVRSTGRRMYFLNDPVEDNPEHSWADYKRNWECTLVASLMWPDVWRYEVAPWPDRVFLGKYPIKDITERTPGEPVEREGIPADYATELLTVFNCLNDMKQSEVSWDCGTQGIGVLVADTMMFQRGEPNPSDPHMGSFFGLAMPLLKSGVPVHPVQYENVGLPGYLQPYKVLFLTYEGMKPPTPDLHVHLSNWVNNGGVLVFVDDDSDPYNSVHEWWNTSPMHYPVPRMHLFEQLGLRGPVKEGTHRIGKGALIYKIISPSSLTKNAEGAHVVRELAKQACAYAKTRWHETNYILLRRGPYIVCAGLDETENSTAKELTGRFVNLFDPELTVLHKVEINEGDRLLLLDLERLRSTKPRVIASASKILGTKATSNSLRFHSEGPTGTIASTRIAIPRQPKSVRVGNYGDTEVKTKWDEQSKTLLLKYPNSADGVWVEVLF